MFHAVMHIRAPRLKLAQRRGFSLIETVLATIIVGVGVMSLMQLFVSCTAQNRLGASMTSAMFLAQNIQEAMADLPFRDPAGTPFGLEETAQGLVGFDDVDDFNGWTSAAGNPIDSTRTALPKLSNYVQAVTVDRVNVNQISQTLVGEDAVRVTVRVSYRPPGGTASEVYRLSWIRMRTS